MVTKNFKSEFGFSMIGIMVALAILAIVIAGVATNSSMQILTRKNTESKLSYRTVEEGLKFQMGEEIRRFVASGGNNSTIKSPQGIGVGNNWIIKFFKKDGFEDLSLLGKKDLLMKVPPKWFKDALVECEKLDVQLIDGRTAKFCMELKVRDTSRKRKSAGATANSADTLMEGFSNFRYAFILFEVAVKYAPTGELAAWNSIGRGRIIEVDMKSYWVHKTPSGVKEVYHRRPSKFYITNK